MDTSPLSPAPALVSDVQLRAPLLDAVPAWFSVLVAAQPRRNELQPLVNDPNLFAAAALRGFAASHSDLVAHLEGGLVRASETRPGHVAVVMGGGSGHFPAFAGWVGVGFGSATAAGNIFASPSETQVLRTARAAENGGGGVVVSHH